MQEFHLVADPMSWLEVKTCGDACVCALQDWRTSIHFCVFACKLSCDERKHLSAVFDDDDFM